MPPSKTRPCFFSTNLRAGLRLRGATRSWGMQIDKAILWRSRRRGSIYNLPALSSLHGASSVWRRSPTQVRSAPVRVKSKNVKYKNDIFGHMPVCPVLVPCVSRLPPGSPVSFYRYCTTYDEVPGVFACSPRRVGRVRSRSRPSAAPRKVQRRRRRCRCNAPI